MNTIFAPFMEFKVSDDAKGIFEGYGSTFGNVDLGKDVCAKGCFVRSLKEQSGNNVLPSMYWMHNKESPIGDWLDVKEDERGLFVKGQLWRDTEDSRKAYNMLKGTGAKGLSIGYVTRKSQYDEKKGVRTLLDVDLPEISVVGHGMNPKALVTSIKAHIADGLLPTIRDLEEVLRDAGLSAVQAKALLADGFKSLRRDGADIELNSESIRLLKELRQSLRV